MIVLGNPADWSAVIDYLAGLDYVVDRDFTTEFVTVDYPRITMKIIPAEGCEIIDTIVGLIV